MAIFPSLGKIALTVILSLLYNWRDIQANLADIVRLIVIICLILSTVFDVVLFIGSFAKSKGCLVSYLLFSSVNFIGSAHILLYGQIWLWAIGIFAIVLHVWFMVIVFSALKELQVQDSVVELGEFND